MSQERGIDWEAVKQRLRESERALEKAQDPQRLQSIYRQRAERLARRRLQEEAIVPLPILTFCLGEERYGLELIALAEVAPLASCAPVPGAPPEVLGLANQRGQIRPVVDLAVLLGLPRSEGTAAGYVLWLRQQVGLKVERVEQVQQVAPGGLIVPGEMDPERTARYTRGLTPDRVRLLDLEAILSHPILKEVSQA